LLSGHRKILAFHKLSAQFTFGATNFSPQRLTRLLDFTASRGYVLRPLSEVLDLGDPRSLAISFDDAYEHLAHHLPWFIETYRLRPIVFVPTQHIGQPATWDYSYRLRPLRHVSADQIKTLSSLGVEFGSHGHTHVDLTALDALRLREELSRSKGTLEELTGERVRYVSYPFGRFDSRVTDETAAAGYEYGFTMRFPRPDDPNPAIGRLAVYGYDTLLAVGQKISGGPFYSLEKWKAAVTNRLSGGTVLYNRLFPPRGTRN
jgi:peptidoglycan/xylan/chitin deacetylase (PgdA/CDA1 family)